ncbi:MAG: DUF2141 domain-containing protein [Gemmatimonadaceae bacterium]|jgi:uncharacterized protein (DUF2141 family)|nr:DUF2141 domain-containing protein [Gemmatimonadaceae bacterium]
MPAFGICRTHFNCPFRQSLAALLLAVALGLSSDRAAAQAPAPAPAPVPGSLTVVIEGARNSRGQLRVSLFDRAEGFPSDQSQALRTTRVPMKATGDSVRFTGLAAGRYAVAVHHDENGNEKLDTRLGLPQEGWAATNDPRPRLRAPRFREAEIVHSGDTRVVVRLTY